MRFGSRHSPGRGRFPVGGGYREPYVPVSAKANWYWVADDLGAVGASASGWTDRVAGVQLGDTASAPLVAAWTGDGGGKCVDFNGTSHYLRSNNAALIAAMTGNDKSITILAQYQDDDAGGAVQTLIAWGTTANTTDKFLVQHGTMGGTGKLKVSKRTSTPTSGFICETGEVFLSVRDPGTTTQFGYDCFHEAAIASDVLTMTMTHFSVGAWVNTSINNFAKYRLKRLWISTQQLTDGEILDVWDVWSGRDALAFRARHAATTPVDIVLYAGQSNAQTYQVSGAVSGYPRTQDASWVESLNNWVYSSTALEPLGQKDVGGTLYYGPWLETAGQLAIAEGRPTLAIMVGKGATTINDWLWTGDITNPRILGRVARKALAAFGGNPRVHLVWHQGESDAANATVLTYYQTRLATLATQLRSIAPGAHIHVVQLHPNTGSTPYGADVRTAQAAFVGADGNASLVDVTSVTPWATYSQADTVHLNAAGVAAYADLITASIQATL